MALRICVLGSSSGGNCTYVATEQTAVLIDAGLSYRQISLRLEQIGARLPHVQAVCLSHEHTDHVAALTVLQKRHHLPVYANRGTVEALRSSPRFSSLQWNIFSTGAPFRIGDLLIHPFAVPHDAYEPVAFRIEAAGAVATIATDVGMPTNLLREQIRGSHLLIIETNHDEHLLRNSSRPPSLIQRILGRQGHLSNETVAALLAETAHPDLQWVLLAHLSEECNRPEIALRTVRRALERAGHGNVQIHCTFPDRPSVVARIGELAATGPSAG